MFSVITRKASLSVVLLLVVLLGGLAVGDVAAQGTNARTERAGSGAPGSPGSGAASTCRGLASGYTDTYVDYVTGNHYNCSGPAPTNLGTWVLNGNINAGNMNGPASSTDNAVMRFDGTTGKLAQNSLVTIDDAGTISTGADNFWAGRGSLKDVTSGINNVALGLYAAQGTTSGSWNVAIGKDALYSSITGSTIVAVGANSMRNAAGLGPNTAIGVNTLMAASGIDNTAVGANVLMVDTTGYDNVGVGSYSLYSNTTGHHNVSVGESALKDNISGFGNVAVGDNAGRGDGVTVEQSTVVDTYGIFLGYQASRDGSVPSATVLTNHTAIGKSARVGASNSIVLGGAGADAVKVSIGLIVPTAILHLRAGTAAAASAPLKFDSGPLLTAAEAGAVEFLTDAFYATITTGAVRKTFAFLESPSFTGLGTNAPAIALGTNPAQTGALRVPTGQNIFSRNAANNADLSLIYSDGTNRTLIGNAAGIIQPQNDIVMGTGMDITTRSAILSGSLTVGSGTAITKHLSATATLDFANQVGVGCEDLTITVTGAAVGDAVAIGIPNGSTVTNGVFYGWVSATNTVSIKFCAIISGDPAPGTFRADVWRH